MIGSPISVRLFTDDQFHPHAYDFFVDDRRFVLALAGRRGAKSYTGAKRMLRKIWQCDWPQWATRPYHPGAARRGTALWWDRRPRLHYWVVADEYKALEEPKRYLLQFLPPELLDHADNQKGTLWLKGDILIEFRTAHDPKSLVGAGLNGAWVEEADRCRSDMWNGFLNPTLMDKGGWCQFTTTPLGQTWTYDDIEKPARDGEVDYGFHHWRTIDNTLLTGMAERIERARRTLPDQYFRREYEASRDAFIGQIYSDFDEHTMVVDSLPPHVILFRRHGGQDWGFSNPGAAVVCGMDSPDPNRGNLWVVDETYEASQFVSDFWIPEVRKHNARWRFNDWACDPERPDAIQLYRDAGIHAVPHRNYTASRYDEHERSVKAGIRFVSALQHQRRFFVLRNCKNVISEMKSYRWDTERGKGLDQGGGVIERPAKGQKNHAMDASRYAATHLFKGANFEAMDIAA